MIPKRYALIGAGARGTSMFAEPIAKELPETAELVAMVDSNPARLDFANALLPRPVRLYADTDAMLREGRSGRPDRRHAGCVPRRRRDPRAASRQTRVLREAALHNRPTMPRGLAAAESSKGLCLTTHNARYTAPSMAIKALLREERLGDVMFMQFDETLDRRHGADYFRRWHCRRRFSGGLQIHKASHHFDLLNWWIGSPPVRVSAQGGLLFYGRNNGFRGTRCRGCEHADTCAFFVDVFDKERARRMYLDAESEDGYIRDGCVWDEAIDIEDQLHVHIEYANGVQVAYTLLAYSPIESQRVVIEGSRARLVQEAVHSTEGLGGHLHLPGMASTTRDEIRLTDPQTGFEEIPVDVRDGAHGGADALIRQDLFARDWDTRAHRADGVAVPGRAGRPGRHRRQRVAAHRPTRRRAGPADGRRVVPQRKNRGPERRGLVLQSRIRLRRSGALLPSAGMRIIGLCLW